MYTSSLPSVSMMPMMASPFTMGTTTPQQQQQHHSQQQQHSIQWGHNDLDLRGISPIQQPTGMMHIMPSFPIAGNNNNTNNSSGGMFMQLPQSLVTNGTNGAGHAPMLLYMIPATMPTSHPDAVQHPFMSINSTPANNPMMSGSNGNNNNSTAQNRPKTTRPPTATWGITVLDPQNKTNPMSTVPLRLVYPTVGLTQYVADANDTTPKPGQPSNAYRMHHKVCPNFGVDGGCADGSWCPHIHVESTFLEQTREVVGTVCCGRHNCCFTRALVKDPTCGGDNFVSLVQPNNAGGAPAVKLALRRHGLTLETVPLDVVSVTLSLPNLNATTTKDSGRLLLIDLDRDVCRLHQKNECRWGKECSRVHLCRDVYARLKKCDK
eukprot:PhM_4_TR3446/c0_g1_i1/m.21938